MDSDLSDEDDAVLPAVGDGCAGGLSAAAGRERCFGWMAAATRAFASDGESEGGLVTGVGLAAGCVPAVFTACPGR